MTAARTIEPAANAQPTKRKIVALPKPRVRPVSDREWAVDFGNGVTATLERDPQGWPEFTWRLTSVGDHGSGGGTTLGHAFTGAWCAAAKAPEPVALSREAVAKLADEAEGCAKDATKVLRKLLKLRTGFDWSVTIGRGTAYSWLSIGAVKKRAADDCGALNAHDQALLGSILGDRHIGAHKSIRPCRGVRASYVWRIAGYPIPDDLYVAPPSWD